MTWDPRHGETRDIRVNLCGGFSTQRRLEVLYGSQKEKEKQVQIIVNITSLTASSIVSLPLNFVF